jgi:uncharacterized protein YoaH (UPF0181 family)
MAIQVERPWEFMAKGLDFGLDLWRLHTMAIQVERPWEFMAKGLDFGLDRWKLHTMPVQVERPWEFMAKGLDFGLDLWRLHTMPGRRLQLLYFIGYFQPISLDSQQSLATQSHSLSTSTTIM